MSAVEADRIMREIRQRRGYGPYVLKMGLKYFIMFKSAQKDKFSCHCHINAFPNIWESVPSVSTDYPYHSAEEAYSALQDIYTAFEQEFVV